MSISTQDFFDGKVSQFAAEAQHDLFLANFFRAVNRTLDEYCDSLDLADIDHITDLEGTIGIAANNEYAFSNGVDMWLIELGHKMGEMTVKEAALSWETSLKKIRAGRDLTQGRDEDEAQVFGMITSD